LIASGATRLSVALAKSNRLRMYFRLDASSVKILDKAGEPVFDGDDIEDSSLEGIE
ncbi:hypothetical protein BGZ80_002152, partial [Entomortierella chlamydospora]